MDVEKIFCVLLVILVIIAGTLTWAMVKPALVDSRAITQLNGNMRQVFTMLERHEKEIKNNAEDVRRLERSIDSQ